MRVVAYARVSTDQQGESGLGLAAQIAAISEEAARRGWKIAEVIEDRGWSGSDLRRPGMGKAIGLLERGDADALVVAKLDRLSRSVLDFASLMAHARTRGFGIIALDCAVDTTTPEGEAMANVMVAFATYERRIIGVRTSEALAELRRQGRAYGPTPFGYRRVGDDLLLDEAEQRVLARVKRLRSRGQSYASIADAPTRSGKAAKNGGRWHATSIRSTLLTSEKFSDENRERAAA